MHNVTDINKKPSCR